jgi:hypothetical protein
MYSVSKKSANVCFATTLPVTTQKHHNNLTAWLRVLEAEIIDFVLEDMCVSVVGSSSYLCETSSKESRISRSPNREIALLNEVYQEGICQMEKVLSTLKAGKGLRI